MNGLIEAIQENVIFLLEFLAVVAALFLTAYAAQVDNGGRKQEAAANREISQLSYKSR